MAQERFIREEEELGESKSLSEVHASVAVPDGVSWFRKLLAFSGPGYLVSVGYMDPGNWATCIAGGSKYGYTLLSVVLVSNLMAMVLQALSARLGIVSGRDLAQACREEYSPWVGFGLWVVCELAIIACDLAEVIGTAIALNLLFHIPLPLGAALTVLDAFLVLMLMQRGFRWFEAFVISLIAIIGGCFAVEMWLATPPMGSLSAGLVPSAEILKNPEMLYIAIGILGATVMPHNLYLHSSVVQTRAFSRTPEGKREACKWSVVDSTLALGLAFLVNAAILVLSAAVFHKAGRTDVAEIEEAYELLSPLLGVGAAATLFGVALLASGFNSTVTGTLAGQVVMEGFLKLRLKPWLRRLVTRFVAAVPVVVVAAISGAKGTSKLLVLSQVILSMQLPFAVVPLVRFATSRKWMGDMVVGRGLGWVAWGMAALIIGLNVWLLWGMFVG